MIGLVLSLVLMLVPQPGYADLGACGQRAVDFNNQQRVERGLVPLKVDWKMHIYALGHSRDMREAGGIYHSDPPPYSENVGEGPDIATINALWLESPGHRRNLLTPGYRWIGPGCAMTPATDVSSRWVFSTAVFR